MSTHVLQRAPVGAASAQPIEATEHPLRWWTLAVMVIAQFMFVVDVFIVNVSLPSIRTNLRATPAELEAIVAAYQIAYATLLITGGRLGDIVGRKLVFQIGLLGFTLASFWCGMSASAPQLIAARVAQGATAALMLPQVLAAIQTLFPAHERARAYSTFGLVVGLGGTAGPILGGVLIELNMADLGWRSAFLVNLPVGVVAAMAAWVVVPRLATARRVRLDVAGTAVLCASVVATLYPLLFARDAGWPWWMLALLCVGLIGFVCFWKVEAHLGARRGQPLVDVDSLRERAFATGLAATFALYLGITSFLLVLTLYLQSGLRMSALRAGLTLAPLAVGFLVSSRRAAHWTERRGIGVLIAGVGLVIVALLWFLIVAHGLNPLGPNGATGSLQASASLRLAWPLALYGFGEGLVIAPLVSTVLGRVRGADAGALSGVLITVQQLSGALGIALVGTAFFSTLSAGFDCALSASCAIMIVAALVSMVLLRRLARVR
jgi:EmrB/QacA subfamily drug resistance transporter